MKYTKHSRGFPTSICDKISRRPLLRIYSELPLSFNKKLYKLFIAPEVRQILHKTAQRALARCECAQHTGFLMKFFNQESVSILILDGVIVDDHAHLRQRCNLLDFCAKGIDLYQKRAGDEAFYILNALIIIDIYIGQLRQSLQH